MEIVKVYKENLPCVKLIGRRFRNEDRDESGTFAPYWQQAYEEGWFDTLQQCEGIKGLSEDSLGVMRMTDEGGFEYCGLGDFSLQILKCLRVLNQWLFLVEK